jgi:hypothetical protein
VADLLFAEDRQWVMELRSVRWWAVQDALAELEQLVTNRSQG